MKKLIRLRFAGTCRMCKTRISAGSSAYWLGEKAGVRVRCYPVCHSEPTPGKATEKKEAKFVSHWNFADIKAKYLQAIEGKATELVSREANRSKIEWFVSSWKDAKDGDWEGCSSESMREYLKSGYHVEMIQDMTPDLISPRKRRRMLFANEGELQLDLALSGFDYPFLQWENRERKPGMSVDIQVDFSASVDSKTITEYQTWCARALYTIEMSGYDVSVTINTKGSAVFSGQRDSEALDHEQRITVKREGEASDFASWSAMFSPGGWRHLGFLALILHSDKFDRDVNGSLGYPDLKSKFDANFDEGSRTLKITCGNSSGFPEGMMTDKLRKILQPKQ